MLFFFLFVVVFFICLFLLAFVVVWYSRCSYVLLSFYFCYFDFCHSAVVHVIACVIGVILGIFFIYVCCVGLSYMYLYFAFVVIMCLFNILYFSQMECIHWWWFSVFCLGYVCCFPWHWVSYVKVTIYFLFSCSLYFGWIISLISFWGKFANLDRTKGFLA